MSKATSPSSMPSPGTVMMIPIGAVELGDNVRTGELPDIPELMESIAKNGLSTPVTMEKSPDGNYILRSGFRRFEALRGLGYTEIPALVRAYGDNNDTVINGLVENLARVDLTTHDLAKTLSELRAAGLTANAISLRLAPKRDKDGKAVAGMSVPMVNKLAHLFDTLPGEIREEWQRSHPLCTINNLETVIRPVKDEGQKGRAPTDEEMLERWSALVTPEEEEPSPEPGEKGSKGAKGEDDSGPKRRGASAIMKMIDALVAAENLDDDKKRTALSVLKWVMGSQKSVLGISLDK